MTSLPESCVGRVAARTPHLPAAVPRFPGPRHAPLDHIPFARPRFPPAADADGVSLSSPTAPLAPAGPLPCALPSVPRAASLPADCPLRVLAAERLPAAASAYGSLSFHEAAEAVLALASRSNQYLEETQPWTKLKKVRPVTGAVFQSPELWHVVSQPVTAPGEDQRWAKPENVDVGEGAGPWGMS